MILGIDARELRARVRTGIGRYVREVTRAAVAAGWRCVLYGDHDTAPLAGASVRRLRAVGTAVWDQVALPRALARDGVAVFLSPYYKVPLRAHCPVVATIHDLFFIAYPGRRRPLRERALTALARRYAGRAAAIVTDSDHSRRAIVDRLGVPDDRVRVIGVAVGEEFRPVPETALVGARYGVDGPYVLYVGNFKPHKNVGGLLRAFAALPSPLRAGHRLLLAGGDTANRPPLEALARQLGIRHRVRFTGLVADADLPALYAGCAALVQPSLEEGFGLPVVEAMACGAPVIVSDRGALPEVAGPAALVVKGGDDGDLAGALERLLTDHVLARSLGVRGLARARGFAPAQTSERVLALLAEVAAR